MKQFKTDVAVLLLFFTRPEQTKKVFESIREARPSKLFLYQDGPREGKNDMEGIMACRKIVENIDWECEVHKKYLEKNEGCDPSGFRARKWMFNFVEKGIVLEDDCVPSQSFYPYCKELLDRYENDPRVEMICGMNNLGTYECGDQDYFFTTSGSIWGCAYWKRVIDEWDANYNFANDRYADRILKGVMDDVVYNVFMPLSKQRSNSGIEFFESIQGADVYLNNRLNIVPCKNMISNVGLTFDAVHTRASKLLDLPRAIRKLYFARTYELNFPLRHPNYIANDKTYEKQLIASIYGSKMSRFFRLRSIEAVLNRYLPFFSKL